MSLHHALPMSLHCTASRQWHRSRTWAALHESGRKMQRGDAEIRRKTENSEFGGRRESVRARVRIGLNSKRGRRVETRPTWECSSQSGVPGEGIRVRESI